MSNTNAFSHLTLEERRIILTRIINGSTKTAIAQTIGKDKSTVGKEIKLHRCLIHKCKMSLECNHYRKCPFDRQCTPDCPEYEPFRCSRCDRTPGACNGCPDWSRCRFDKYQYCPEDARMDYRTTLAGSREGVNLSWTCATRSPVRFPKRSPKGTKKRADRKYLKGRTYKDYRDYMSENPDVFVTQMDTVYNDETGSPFIQTFKFVNAGTLFAVYHGTRTAQAMKDGVDLLKSVLGTGLSRKYVHVLLTDRGPEFTAAGAMEAGAGAQEGPRCSSVTPCSPDRKDHWRTNISSSDISFQKART